MAKASRMLCSGRKALKDLALLKVVQSEIAYEVSSADRFQGKQSGPLGGFTLDYDAPQSQDVLLWRKFESGEEVAVSALLGPENYEREGFFPREVLMKVCIKKPGLHSILQFDCGVNEKQIGSSEFFIHNACYLQSATCPSPSAYKGPYFCSLDPQLRDAFKEYLVARGIGENITNFLLLHLHKKEQGQYVNWLQKLELLVAKGK